MKVDVLGVQINSDAKPEILRQIEARLALGKSTFIVTPYSESIVAAQKDEDFRKILNGADFALPDGAGVIWAARSKYRSAGADEISKVPGREFFWDLCALAESRGQSIFLLGGFGDTPELVAKKLKEKFPDLKIAGTSSPPRDPFDSPQDHLERSRNGEEETGEVILDQINSAKTDFLFAALGPIRQEKWIFENLPKLRVKLAMGVGGTFDYIAGKRPLPPQFLSSWGLEWLWRLVTQPTRFPRIIKGVLGLIWYTLKARM